MNDAQVVEVGRGIVEVSRSLADAQGLFQEPDRFLETALVLVQEAEVVVGGGHAALVVGAAIGRDRALEVLARGIPFSRPQRDRAETHLGVTEIEIERGVAEEPVGHRRGAMRRPVAPALEEQDAESRGEPADLLARDVRAKTAMEIVERFDRFVQIAPVPQALDDLGSGLEKRFLTRRVPAATLDLEGAAVVLERYGEIVGSEIEVTELMGLPVPVTSRPLMRLGRGISQNPLRIRTVFGNKCFHTGPRLPIQVRSERRTGLRLANPEQPVTQLGHRKEQPQIARASGADGHRNATCRPRRARRTRLENDAVVVACRWFRRTKVLPTDGPGHGDVRARGEEAEESGEGCR